jgi:hypothetical protein
MLLRQMAALVSDDDSDAAWRRRHDVVRWLNGLTDITPAYRALCLVLEMDPAVFRHALDRQAREVVGRLLGGESIASVVPEATNALPLPNSFILEDQERLHQLWMVS